MEFNIGDTVRIVSDPNIWFFGGGDYEIGDIATIEAIELNNQRVWYKLDVEMFDEDQTTWQEKNLELPDDGCCVYGITKRIHVPGG